jgi:hypothetical protein
VLVDIKIEDPLINPEVLIPKPAGKPPETIVYINDVAGANGIADNWYDIEDSLPNVPIVPGGVFQMGCAILILYLP